MTFTSPTQITIDGPAASGKSTVARRLADAIGAYYVNTGEMYRALTWHCLGQGIDPERSPQEAIALLPRIRLAIHPAPTPASNGRNLDLYLNDSVVDAQVIRTPEVTAKVSQLAALPAVREWLVKIQREAAGLGTIVMEGRDIGTVVFPQARHKFFIVASPEERARRRLAQSGEVASDATLQSIIDEIAQRDRLDSARAVAPLRPASDAMIVDTSNLTIAEVVTTIIGRLHRRDDETIASFCFSEFSG